MALPATVVWEVQTGGNDLNGAGFDSAFVGTGTDWSQTTAVQVTFNGTTVTASNGGASATITVAGYTVASTDVGNVVNIASGTNFTAGYYAIASVNVGASTWTLDRACTTGAGSAMVGRMGGCALTIQQMVNVAIVTTNQIYVKAGTYTITAAITFRSNFGCTLEGYTTTRGDNGVATITCSTNSINKFTGYSSFVSGWYIKNFIIQDTAGTRGNGILSTANSDDGGPFILSNVTIDGCLNGISAGSNGWISLNLYNCIIKNCTATGIVNSNKSMFAYDCLFYNNATSGVIISNVRAGAYALYFFERCVFANNTGSGFKDTSQPTNSAQRVFENCVFYTNSTDGIRIDVAYAAALVVRNCIFLNNTGYGINFVQTNAYNAQFSRAEANAFFGNTTAQVLRYLSTGAVTLSGDPFVAASSQNFALDATASEGALCRAAGATGARRDGMTSYHDIGAIQHADPAAAGGLMRVNPMQGGF